MSGQGQTFAYLRVSKLDQDLEKNKLDILKLANDAHLGHVQFVEEKVSGKVFWRLRQIATILENAQEGDTIIVSELSRLGRSMLECMEILSLAMQKGIRIYAVTVENGFLYVLKPGQMKLLGLSVAVMHIPNLAVLLKLVASVKQPS